MTKSLLMRFGLPAVVVGAGLVSAQMQCAKYGMSLPEVVGSIFTSGKQIAREFTKPGDTSFYDGLTNEVAQLEVTLQSGVPNAREIARTRARVYSEDNRLGTYLAEQGRNPLPLPGDIPTVRAVNRIRDIAGY